MKMRIIITIGILALLTLITCLVWSRDHISSFPLNKPVPAATDTSTMYKNDTYGFTVRYPKQLAIDTTFQRYYHLSDTWMSEAAPDSKGVPVISIPVYRITNKADQPYRSYPYYFDAELRIGVSTDTQDVAHCYASQFAPSATVMINSIAFQKFSVRSAGMSQYLIAESYRTIHNNACYVIEQIKAGSSYREAATPDDIPDTVLDAHYNAIDPIIQSFRFIR